MGNIAENIEQHTNFKVEEFFKLVDLVENNLKRIKIKLDR